MLGSLGTQGETPDKLMKDIRRKPGTLKLYKQDGREFLSSGKASDFLKIEAEGKFRVPGGRQKYPRLSIIHRQGQGFRLRVET